jgi:two-component system, OmpR family, sensor histidine kinase KdpD
MTGERPDEEVRPSPEALLKEASRESRGRLKIFLGAAPGVGKTYAMLSQGRQRRLDGVDVVIGVAETHGRVETDLLTKGFETIPKKRAPYRGQVLAEMDLDAILQRKPQLVLVDELAHTNAPGSRHPKRYLDVEEVLAAGIDVYSTLNVQHIESLTDVVAKITHVQVRETVPDSILDRADEVEVVDLTPEDLIQRLREGKVYVPELAVHAIRNYFTAGNLTALREIALRRTAQRVDEQMVDYMRAHAIQGPWEASERILVCVNESPGSVGLVRYARRLADRLRASWTTIHVETGVSQRLSDTERDRIAEALRLAERLGGQAVTIPASDAVQGLVAYARENNFTHLVIAKSRRTRWSEVFLGSVTARLIRNAGAISVHVIAPAALPVTDPRPRAAARVPERRFTPRDYVETTAMVVAALLLGEVLKQFLAVSNIALVFLTAILASAIAYGLWTAVFACALSLLAYNFFFIPPLYTFTIGEPENVVNLFFFGFAAVVVSNLTARVRAQAVVARNRARTTEDLYQFSRKLAGVVTLDDLLWATAFQIASMLKLRVVILLPEHDTVEVRTGYPPEDVLDEADLAAAKWVWAHGQPAGRGSDTLPGAKRLFLPMRTGRGVVGVVGLDNDQRGPLLSPDQRRLYDALADQAALAIERVHLAEDVDRARIAAAAEKLRSNLLTSISHDLRTPLASILGSATALKDRDSHLDEGGRRQLVETIQEESERLNRFISDLLNMTRLEAGAIQPHCEAVDIGDIVGSALRRAATILAGHRIETDIRSDLPMAKIDPVLFEQVLFNLLDNAAKYAPPGTTIRIHAMRADGALELTVADEGQGVPEGDLERIFDKFYRVHAADRQRAGTGLGLAICRGFMEAMAGTIVARNRSAGTGAIFALTLPIATLAPAPESQPA